jgi:hypothetical protein
MICHFSQGILPDRPAPPEEDQDAEDDRRKEEVREIRETKSWESWKEEEEMKNEIGESQKAVLTIMSSLGWRTIREVYALTIPDCPRSPWSAL